MSRRDQEIQYSACFQHVGSLYVSGDRFRPGFGIYDSGIARCALLPFVGIFWSLVSLPFAGVKYGMSSDRIFGAVRQSASGMPEGVVSSFVRNSDAMAIVSVASIVDELRSGELRIIDIEGCTIRREFSFCWPEGRSDALAARFVEFARHTA